MSRVIQVKRRSEGGLTISYHNVETAGTKIFYRETGSKSQPSILLLHGFPTSSHMFRNLIPALADRYHVVAPDLPGFGFSNAPDRTRFFGWCDCVQYARIESHPGALGKSAFDGGFPAVVLGCVLHFFIAFVAAAVYALASPWIPALRKHFVTFGLLDLVAVYLIMIMWCCRWQLSVPVPSSQAFF